MPKNIEENNFRMSPYIEFYNLYYTDKFVFADTPHSPSEINNNFNFIGMKQTTPNAKREEINSNYYRSRNFTNLHKDKHILFTGCSYTWGVGMDFNETWAKIVYDEICKKEKTSGYFNLGIPANSIYQAVFDIFRYCRSYGNPDVIFFNMPDFYRFLSINHDNNKPILGMYQKDTDADILLLVAYQYYFMLEQYCKANNIKLFSFTWTQCFDKTYEEKSMFSNFKTFYFFDVKNQENFIIKYAEENQDKEFLLLARDNDHLGIAYHQYWANFILEKYYNG